MAAESSQPLRAAAGASLLSAAATLPLHLLPVLVLALGTSGTLPRAHAGWVGSAYMLGQLATVLLMPACSVNRVPWAVAALAVVAIPAATWVSAQGQAAVILGAWLVVGVMAGVLQYLANTTAAAAGNRRAAFALRMAASSSTAAALMAWLQVSQVRIADYGSVCLQFALVFCTLAVAGLLLYRTDAVPPVPVHQSRDADLPQTGISGGLAVLFLLFVGQQGLWAVVMQTASARALALDQIVWTICAAKLLGAAAVLLGNIREVKEPSAADLAVSGAIVAAGGLCMGLASTTPVYVLGLALCEIALNVLSARYQALLACKNPRAAGMWIAAGIFLGAASGHALAPHAAASGHLGVFIGFAVITALAPGAWAALTTSRSKSTCAAYVADV